MCRHFNFSVAGFLAFVVLLCLQTQAPIQGKLKPEKNNTKQLTTRIGYFLPGPNEFRYPNIPDKVKTNTYDKSGWDLLHKANTRYELVIWADKNHFQIVQNIGRDLFLIARDIGYGKSVWVVFIYSNVSYRYTNWELLYAGIPEFKSDPFFDYVTVLRNERKIRFGNNQGKVLCELYIGKEWGLISQRKGEW
jgi:hypothetical protein